METVAVIGAGVMGSGIALCAIQSGYPTLLFDVNAESLEKGVKHIQKQLAIAVEKGKTTQDKADVALQRLSSTTNKNQLIASFIIEAVIEKLSVKQELFTHLESINSPHTILATNTSSIPITQIGAPLKHPERLVGVHFFNPAHIMKLVEIIKGAATSPDIAKAAFNWALSLGKTAVYAEDAPGFIVNRVARHYYVESLKILEENVADIPQIDNLLQASGFKMGAFKLMDLIGVDTNFSVTSSMYQQFHYDPKFRPSRIQQQKVDAGHHGQKTKMGFYTYE
ncbi:MAG: 3-hydroxyacyl-CoA dehydrogenase NAD-binding domain-containing protein [Bacteroidota bacterium]|jgi:3-hydroxybutyryl-CoA dehydrogenase